MRLKSGKLCALYRQVARTFPQVRGTSFRNHGRAFQEASSLLATSRTRYTLPIAIGSQNRIAGFGMEREHLGYGADRMLGVLISGRSCVVHESHQDAQVEWDSILQNHG
jgi:hypothetical protein